MPLPKRRHSSQRQAKRRTHYKLTPPSIGTCPRCQSAVQSHHICAHCGYYNGRQWVVGEAQQAAA